MKLLSFKTITGGYVFYSIIYFIIVGIFFTLTQGSTSLFENFALSACSRLNVICLCCIFWVLLFISSFFGMIGHYFKHETLKFNAFQTVFILSTVVLLTIAI